MRRLTTLLSLILLSIMAAWPLLQYGPPLQANAITDGPTHLYRLALLERHIQHGDLYPRWFSDLHYGFGAPILNYYAPLSYYILIGLHLFIPALPTVFQWGFILGLSAAVWGAFFWAREQFSSEAAGVTAATAYAFTPYIYFSILQRAAYPELWGLAVAPWVFWATLRVIRQPTNGRRLAFTLLYAAFILTHNLSALLFTPILLAYGAALTWQQDSARRERLTRLGLSLAQAVGIAAFFLLPFLLESSNVQLERTRNYYYGANFHPAAELFSLPVAFDPQHVIHPFPVSVPWPQLGLAVLGTALVLRRPDTFRLRWITAIFALSAALLISLNLHATLPVWNLVPLATIIQFPYRLLGPAMLLLAWLAAACVAQAAPQWRQWLATGVVGLTFFYSLTWTHHEPFDTFPATLSPADIIRDEIANPTRFGSTNLGEFLPRWVAEVPSPDTLLARYAEADIPSRLAPLPESVKQISETVTLTSSELTYDSDSTFTATYNIFYFPGWAATLDGDGLPIQISQPNGLIQVADVPAGQHTLRLALQPTLSQIAGSLISLLAVGLLFIPWPRALDKVTEPQKINESRTWLVPAFLIGLVVVRLTILDRVETPFYRYGLRHVSNPVAVNFDNQLQLAGYDLPHGERVRSGEALQVNLYWRAATPLSEDYHTSIQLIDRFGNRFGQSDHQHPAGVPTSRWQPEEYALDAHELVSLAGTPPGDYRLVVSAYASGPLAVLDEANTATGLSYELGAVTVTRGPTQVVSPLRVVEGSLAVQTASVGEALPFTITWTTGAAPAPSLTAQLKLSDSGGQTLFTTMVAPAGPDYPSELWSPNELIRYPHSIDLPADLPAGQINVSLSFVDSGGAPVSEPVELGSIMVSVPERSFVVPPIAHRVDYDFADQVRLLGFNLEADGITLYWQAINPATKRITVFIHAFDLEGNFVSGQDAPPLRSTTSWLPGEVVTDYHPFAPGERFEIGLYDPVTGERLGTPYSYAP